MQQCKRIAKWLFYFWVNWSHLDQFYSVTWAIRDLFSSMEDRCSYSIGFLSKASRTAVSFGSESCGFILEFPCNSTDQHPVSLHVDHELSVTLASFTPRNEISK